MGLFGGDFRVGVGHGKDHRVVGHGGDHLGRHGALDRHAQKHISAHHRLFQRAVIGTRGVSGFPLVHALGAALIDHAFGVAHDAVVMPRAHGFQKLEASNARSPCTVQNNLTVLNLLARHFQRIDQACRTDHCGAVLVIMEHGNVHDLFQPLFDDETFGGLDVFKVDAAEGWPHQRDGLDDLIRVFGIKFDVDGVDVGEALEQHRLALHHRLGRQRPKVAHAQNGRAVRDDGNHVAFDRIVIGGGRIVGDGLHRNGNAGGIGERQITLRGHGG